ncbi:MAG: hypothetical protein ACFCU2_07845 [Acidimicrobiia bacterium]
MPTILGVFRDHTDPDSVIEQLVSRGTDREHIGVVWREKIVRRAEEIEVVTYVDHFEGPAIEAKKGAWGGVLGGAAFGVASALLAGAGIILGPNVAVLLGGGTAAAAAAAAAAGAAGGGLAGTAIGALLGATDRGATKRTTTETDYHDVTETDGFVITVEAGSDRAAKETENLEAAGATEITILGAEGSTLRSHLESVQRAERQGEEDQPDPS